MTREEWEHLIISYWDGDALAYYLSQLLSGECSIEETREDLLSFTDRGEK